MAETPLEARIATLERLVEEREDRVKERLASLEKVVTASIVASDRAVSKAELATEKRFEAVNEFRAALQDQTSTLLPRAEYNLQHKGLQDVVSAVHDRVVALERTMTPRIEYEALHKVLEATVQNNAERLNALTSLQEGKRQGLGFLGQIVLGGVATVAASAAALSALLHLLK